MEQTFKKKGLTKKSENISEWYHDVVLRAELADYSEVKGSMIIRPYGYAIWERVQTVLDGWFKDDGVQNAYFPLLIPMHLLQKEKEHIAGFSPELAVVTYAGGEELTEPLAVRPTSETIMYQTFKDWIQSWRDLPLKINQWCNIVRWEKRTFPFLRTSEFLWQEGHTAHVDDADAQAMTLKALGWYEKFYRDYFAIAPYVGQKSEGQKFAGAKATYSTEIVMPDGKALQAATSHHLGDNFSKAFDVQYLDAKGAKQYVQQTSWGISTRAIGGLVMSHGDDSGLVLPPRVAQIQVVVLAVSGGKESDPAPVREAAAAVATELATAGIRARLDDDFEHSLGFRINTWELKGVPLRLELGPKDLKAGTALSVRRDNFTKEPIPRSGLAARVQTLLDSIQKDLLAKSEQMKKDMTVETDDYDEFKQVMGEGKKFIRTLWCESLECEVKIKEETKATPRVLELERMNDRLDGACVACEKPASRRWLFAQSY